MHYFMSFLEFAFILTRKRELVALIVLSFGCLVTVDVLWLFGAVGWSTVCDILLIFS